MTTRKQNLACPIWDPSYAWTHSGENDERFRALLISSLNHSATGGRRDNFNALLSICLNSSSFIVHSIFTVPVTVSAAEQIPFPHVQSACRPRLHIHLQQSVTYANTTGRVYTWKRNRSGVDMYFSVIKHTCKTIRTRLHINTQQPLVGIYINSYLYMQQAFFTHAHTACSCLHMYKKQAPCKHVQPVGPERMYMHNQQASFTYVKAAGSVYTYTPVGSVYIACRQVPYYIQTHLIGDVLNIHVTNAKGWKVVHVLGHIWIGNKTYFIQRYKTDLELRKTYTVVCITKIINPHLITDYIDHNIPHLYDCRPFYWILVCLGLMHGSRATRLGKSSSMWVANSLFRTCRFFLFIALI